MIEENRLKKDLETEAKDHLKEIFKVNPTRPTSKTKNKINKKENIQKIPTRPPKHQTPKTKHKKRSQ